MPTAIFFSLVAALNICEEYAGHRHLSVWATRVTVIMIIIMLMIIIVIMILTMIMITVIIMIMIMITVIIMIMIMIMTVIMIMIMIMTVIMIMVRIMITMMIMSMIMIMITVTLVAQTERCRCPAYSSQMFSAATSEKKIAVGICQLAKLECLRAM